VNNFSATGRVGRDAELRDAGNSKVLGFALAVDSGFGNNKQTLWFDCSLWGERGASLSQYIVKGQELAVTGEIGMAEKSGKMYLKLRVGDVTLIGGKPDASKQKPAPKPAPKAAPPADSDEDPIPF